MSFFSLFNIFSNGLWHWSISGFIIGIIVPALLLVGNKSFGISSSLKHICSIALPLKTSFFNYDLKPHYWSFYFMGGVVLGGAISYILGNPPALELGPKTMTFLNNNNLALPVSLYPKDLYNFHNIHGILLIVIGGFLIGFGTRWAQGCTSGHSIFGIANFQKASFIATIAFFIGGLTMTHFILRHLI